MTKAFFTNGSSPKYKMTFVAAVLMCLFMAGCKQEEIKPAEPAFSVAEERQVLFSPGNLQFCTVGSHATVILPLSGEAREVGQGTYTFTEKK